MTKREPSNRLILIYLTIFAVIFIWSAIHPYDRLTWAMEVFPAILGLLILAITFKRFRFTHLVYTLILIEAIILMVGGHYTYAREPFFSWLSETFHWGRNHYDKLGHFAQGFIPAIITREILLRTSPLRPGKWLFFLIVSVCLAISAAYELLEWFAAITQGSAAEDFLGTQGYVWDTQSDMALALLGAILALLCLSRVHNRALKRLKENSNT